MVSTNTEVGIYYSINSSMVTIHETTSPTIYIKLDSTNYSVWSQILDMHIVGKKKKGYITGTKVAPVENDPNYDEWKVEDVLVKSWLINSMIDKLMSHFLQCGTAKEVWDAVKRSYLDVFHSSQVHELMKKSFQSHQGGCPLTKYYNELNSIYMELDYQRSNDMMCVVDIKKQRKRTVEDRVYVFLTSLDHNLDQVSGRVLATSPLPSLEETYSLVRREAQRQVTMGIDDHSKASEWLSMRIAHNQHLLLLMTPLLASALIEIAPNIQ